MVIHTTIGRRPPVVGGRRPRATGHLATAASTLVTAAVLAGCSQPQPVPQLRMAGPHAAGEFGLNIVAPRPGAQLSVGAMNLCIDSGTADITDAHFHDGDLAVQAFRVRALQADEVGLGYLPGTLMEHGFPATSQPVAVACASSEQPGVERAELGITVASDAAKPVRGRDLVVSYSTSNGPGELTLPLRLVVCPPDRATPCERPGAEGTASATAPVLPDVDEPSS